MKTPPSIGQAVCVTDLTAPPLMAAVTSIVGYDPHHDAWRVSATSMELWVRSRPGLGWRLYDISTPLHAERPG